MTHDYQDHIEKPQPEQMPNETGGTMVARLVNQMKKLQTLDKVQVSDGRIGTISQWSNDGQEAKVVFDNGEWAYYKRSELKHAD